MDQAQILRKMTGEQRLKQALSLSDFVRELAIMNIKSSPGTKNPSKKLLRKELFRRFQESETPRTEARSFSRLSELI